MNSQSDTPVRVLDLKPGDKVWLHGRYAVFISQCPHPLYPELQLVIWVTQDGDLMMDALAINQHVGELRDDERQASRARLRRVMLGVQYKRVQ